MADGPENYKHSKCSRPDTGASAKVQLIAYKPVAVHGRTAKRACRDCDGSCHIAAVEYESVVQFIPGITTKDQNKEWRVFRRFPSKLASDPGSQLGYWVSGRFGHASILVPCDIRGQKMIIFGTHRNPHGEDQASYVPSGKLILHNAVGEHDFSAQDEEIEKIGILVRVI